MNPVAQPNLPPPVRQHDPAPAHHPAVSRPAGRQARAVAHLIPLLVLPSAVWRTVLSFGVPLGFDPVMLEADRLPGWGTVELAVLTVLIEVLALASFALVRPWGEAVPAWVPRLRRRRIPPLAVTMPAAIGAVLLTVIWTFAIAGLFTGRIDEVSGVGWLALLIACYAPALAWGPLLLWLTVDYHRRRRAA